MAQATSTPVRSSPVTRATRVTPSAAASRPWPGRAVRGMPRVYILLVAPERMRLPRRTTPSGGRHVPDIEKVLAHHAAHAASYRADLEALIRIPSVSFDGFPPVEVKRSAEA